jgi:hypothetical protein
MRTGKPIRHGESHFRGKPASKEYSTWCAIKKRCYNPNDGKYADYGGRGIKMCERWKNSYEAFLEDMGRAPSPLHTMDRIENDGNYELSNCKWATRSEQSKNRMANRYITFNGVTQCVTDWGQQLGIKRNTILARLNSKWSIEDTLTSPLRKNQFG